MCTIQCAAIEFAHKQNWFRSILYYYIHIVSYILEHNML